MNEDLTRKMPNASDGKLDEVFQIIQAIRAELSDLRSIVETRIYDTRPIWEKVQADIAQLQAGQARRQAGQDGLQAAQTRLQAGQDGLQAGQNDLQAGQNDLQAGQNSLQAGQNSLQAGQDSLRGDVREIRTHLRDMDRRLSIFNDTLVGIQADYRDIYDRVREIERQRT
jgi:chromosome segregation ATPase